MNNVHIAIKFHACTWPLGVYKVYSYVSKGELLQRNQELAAAAVQAEVLLRDISVNTAIAERERARVATIVSDVTTKAQVRGTI